jgi:hypothetical protein
MRYCFIFIAFVSLLCSCKGTQPVDDADVLVKVKDRRRKIFVLSTAFSYDAGDGHSDFSFDSPDEEPSGCHA